MSTSSFTPSDAIDLSKERDWPAQIGMLDWDNTNIVFTKRSLLEFLKYAGVTVDTNFTNIQKLPRYAQFGKLSGGANTNELPAAGTTSSTTTTTPSPSAPASDFKPTRRVREPPGGSHANIFNFNGDDNDALAAAPQKPFQPSTAEAAPAPAAEPQAESEEADSQSKSKRTTSGVAGLWAPAEQSESFKPTRRYVHVLFTI
ncbi:hypothetical protein OH76DRAFT_1408058 [Lentinus brumalis]|uniref:Uncharacterized protein n=1 Tax=Lentinus brumalis TaxID=2498619 RepID=A0A371CYW8_9APHY|nr:hypothetical protein OH76DRAFT_1408058 [Polyporus brumalis]